MSSPGIRPALLGLVMAFATVGPTRAQGVLTANRTADASRAAFVYTDIEHFIDVLDDLPNAADTALALKEGYFLRGTPGLAIFVEKYDLTPESLRDAIRRFPDDYARLPATLASIRDHEDVHREAYRQLATLLPDTEFPPTYFLVGAHRGIGSGSTEGPLLTVEKEQSGDVSSTLVHEMTHLQQLRVLGERYFSIFNEEESLLAYCIREGAAEFFSEQIVGGDTYRAPVRRWLMEHEVETWDRFRRDMLRADTGDWLWADPADPEQPRDVGYVLGARIVEVYYRNAADRQDAARTILAVDDYPGFLAESGYQAHIDGLR